MGSPVLERPEPGIARVPSWLATGAAWTWRVLLLLLGATVILIVMVRLYLVTLPVIIALILATLCVGPARWMERQGVPRMLAAVIVVIGGLAAIGGLFTALAPQFIEQVQELGPTIQDATETLLGFVQTTFGWDRAEVMDMLNEGLAALSEQSGQIATQVVSGAAIAVQALTALSLAVVLLFFFVKDGAQIVDWMIARTPKPHQETMRAVGRRAWTALAGFIRGTAAIALIDAVGIGIGLAIVGVPLVLPLSVLIFIGAFIPVIGATVTGLLAVLVALATADPGTAVQTALIVLAIIIGVQQIESNVLQPVIMRRAVALHPVVVLGALTAGAALIGVIGAFLAVPVAAVLSAVANELRLRHEATQQPATTPDDGPPDDGPPDNGPPDNGPPDNGPPDDASGPDDGGANDSGDGPQGENPHGEMAEVEDEGNGAVPVASQDDPAPPDRP
jgi:putative heme transporter